MNNSVEDEEAPGEYDASKKDDAQDAQVISLWPRITRSDIIINYVFLGPAYYAHTPPIAIYTYYVVP